MLKISIGSESVLISIKSRIERQKIALKLLTGAWS